jgi:hypothetical protein
LTKQIQALERTQPNLPIGLGHIDGITQDYKRHGTTTLFAALDGANGQVPGAVPGTPPSTRSSWPSSSASTAPCRLRSTCT